MRRHRWLSLVARAPTPTSRRRCATSAFNVVSIATDHRLRQHRLRPVADVRAAVDAVPVQLRHQRRLDRRRHQDDARHAAVQAGVPRD
ncbi:MAG: hypothetical protein MZW92_76225 [Comamonadaceae bacterium]|nr:hypothetical protein [Comamonadaceae bacterium]